MGVAKQERRPNPFQSGKHTELAALTRRVRNNHNRLKKNLDYLQESLDSFRLVTKYHIFDLEDTRRAGKECQDERTKTEVKLYIPASCGDTCFRL